MAFVALATLAIIAWNPDVEWVGSGAGVLVAVDAGGGIRLAFAHRAGSRESGMATGAAHPGVRTRAELEAVVVRREARRGEAPGVVTGAAIRSHRVGVVVQRRERSPLPVLLVAVDAIDRGAIEAAIAHVEVALLAGDQRVPATEWEVGAVVCLWSEEGLPGLAVVTGTAVSAEPRPVGIEVARCAGSRDGSFVTSAVAASAVGSGVCALQRMARLRVVECRGLPAAHRVAGFAAALRRLKGPIAVGGLLQVLGGKFQESPAVVVGVAAIAGSRHGFEAANLQPGLDGHGGVAFVASKLGVLPFEQEVGVRRTVIKSRGLEAGCRMTTTAVGRLARARRDLSNVSIGVAGGAGGGSTFESNRLFGPRGLVAGRTGDRGVFAVAREARVSFVVEIQLGQ